MQIFTLPPVWDAKKFAARYSLDSRIDFYVNAERKLVVFPTISDNPPIFDLPDPHVPQGILSWEASEVPGAVRLVATYAGKKSVIVGGVGTDSTQVAMYQSPGPTGQLPAGPRREWHVATKADIVNIPTAVAPGDTLYIEGDGEYRYSQGAWHRILIGPSLGTPADVNDIYTALFAALDTAINPQQGPSVDPRVKAVLVELKKVLGG